MLKKLWLQSTRVLMAVGAAVGHLIDEVRG
jgi:hypothetical protein